MSSLLCSETGDFITTRERVERHCKKCGPCADLVMLFKPPRAKRTASPEVLERLRAGREKAERQRRARADRAPAGLLVDGSASTGEALPGPPAGGAALPAAVPAEPALDGGGAALVGGAGLASPASGEPTLPGAGSPEDGGGGGE